MRHPALVSLTLAFLHCSLPGEPSRVEIRSEQGRFRLYRNGSAFFVKGAVWVGDGGGRFPMKELAARGANAIRAGANLKTLDEAHALGLAVLVNLPMRMESVHKFDYSDEKAVGEQFERMKKIVLEFKDHPAVLAWSIGNELSVRYTNRRVWNAVGDVARMIHEVDPLHPTLTVVGDGSMRGGDLAEIRERAPALDLLGVNMYKDLNEVPALLRKGGWEKPYFVSEWGPSGDWQVARTSWKASIEETSTEKAEKYLDRYQKVILADKGRCLGSFVFIWSSRRERTKTWYGMFLDSGERTEAVNVMQYNWTGQWPANRAPRVENMRIAGKAALENPALTAGAESEASVTVSDPEGDPLAFRWEILAEVPRAGYAGMGERHTEPVAGLIGEFSGGRLKFTAPREPGAYRLFVFVTDGQGNAATANVPFSAAPAQ